MSSYAISGKPGGGKTLYAVSKIIEELVHGERCVVTNVALKLPEINEYFQKKYPDKQIDLFKRVRVLSDEEVRKFYLYRSEAHDIQEISKEEWKQGKRLNYSNAGAPVLYVLDEIHIFLNARAWMETGEGVLFYMSQHRKLGDDVVWITQAIQNVDRQFRSVTQDYTYVRNFRKEKFMRFFRRGEGFERRTYLEPYTGAQHPTDVVKFKLDPEISSCYDTSAGIGIHNRGQADSGEKVKGFKMKWVWATLLGGFVLVMILSFCFPKVLNWYFTRNLSKGESTSKTSIVSSSIPTLKTPPQLSPLPVSSSQENIVHSFYTFKHKALDPSFSSPLEDVVFKLDLDTNTVYFSGASGKVSVVQSFLKQMDQALAQVRLKLVLCTASLTESETFSFQWLFQHVASLSLGMPQVNLLKLGNGLLLSGSSSHVLEYAIESSAKKGTLHVITRPQLVVQHGKTGVLRSGRQVAIPSRTIQNSSTVTTVDYKTVALEVEVTPQVLNDQITLKIHQKNDDIARMLEIDGNQVPELSTQELNTSVTMRSGDWASIGGITLLSKSKTKSGIPWLMDVPILGSLFSKTSLEHTRLELGILIHAEIVNLNEVRGGEAEGEPAGRLAPPARP